MGDKINQESGKWPL